MSYTLLKQRADTTANWISANPILKEAEIGVDLTTKSFKIGDGVTHWVDIKPLYIAPSVVTAKGDLIVGTGLNDTTKLPRGTTGQRLTVMGDGSLAWITTGVPSEFETSVHAAATYETIAESNSEHALLISAATMAATYKSQTDFYADHALLLDAYTASLTYETGAHAVANYAPKLTTKVKAALTNRNNTAVLALDPDMQFAALASSSYIFEMVLLTEASTAADMKLDIQAPAGSELYWGVHAPASNIASSVVNANVSDAVQVGPSSGGLIIGGSNISKPLIVTIKGSIIVHATAGTVGVIFAQNVATNDGGATILASSYMRVTKTA